MISTIRRTPVSAAGVSPSQRVKLLRSIGVCAQVKMSDLTEGNVILLPNGAFVVQRTHYDLRRRGARLTLRDLDGASVRSIPFSADAWVTQLQIPAQVAEDEGLWIIQNGDIVIYPGEQSHNSVAAIRHHDGWQRTAAPWAPLSDAEILLRVQDGTARVIRSALRKGVPPLLHYPVGSVVASRDTKVLEPTVWIRTGDDFWTSNSRGATASDLMINYELDRRTYHVVWVPEEDL